MNEIKSKKLVERENTSRELRQLIQLRKEEINKEHYNKGWNDAINEFAKRVKDLRYRTSHDGGETFYTIQAFCDRDIDEIVDQLKGQK